MIVRYADPPYFGCCKLYNHNHPTGDRPFDGRCWDDIETHAALVEWLGDDCDGWAMSLTSNSLQRILPLCPDDVRVGAWVKPFHAYKRNVRPAYAWEPVIYWGGRQQAVIPDKGGKATTPKDFVSANITLRRGLTGAKPEAFCFWLFDLMGLQPGDTFADVFTGSGAVADAWAKWSGAETCDQNALDFTVHLRDEAAELTRGQRG